MEKNRIKPESDINKLFIRPLEEALQKPYKNIEDLIDIVEDIIDLKNKEYKFEIQYFNNIEWVSSVFQKDDIQEAIRMIEFLKSSEVKYRCLLK
jgi:hypothetical protein